MLEIIQWFDDKDRFIGLCVFVAIVGWSMSEVVGAFRKGE